MHEGRVCVNTFEGNTAPSSPNPHLLVVPWTHPSCATTNNSPLLVLQPCQPQSPLAVHPHPAPPRPGHQCSSDSCVPWNRRRQPSSLCSPRSRAFELLSSQSRCGYPSLNPAESRRPLIWDGQRAIQNAEDVAQLETSFSNLLTVLQPPLQNSETWTPVLRRRVEDLSRSLQLLVPPCIYRRTLTFSRNMQ